MFNRATPGDHADVRHRPWRQMHGGRYFDRRSFSSRWMARSGAAGIEHPFLFIQSMIALLRSFPLNPSGIPFGQSASMARLMARAFTPPPECMLFALDRVFSLGRSEGRLQKPGLA